VNDKMNVFETEVVGLPTLGLVPGQVPNPDPSRNQPDLAPIRKPSRELETTVRRLIAHLEKERQS
jgi:hypothetical protein